MKAEKNQINIILLSGGSGKRLWPLSNDARSKQFLKLFTDDKGNAESMVQRVYRQINESGMNAHIMVATSAYQADSIRMQLGENVEIISEPERRDTFPAISLASVYLYEKNNANRDETVIVMPVDPYTESGYFETIIEMERAVRENAADIVLMGITPTYPSEKYGYILPEDTKCEGCRKVKKFVEKPNESYANALIDRGALWNGGVFAFKLGYLIDQLTEQAAPLKYDAMRKYYGKMRAISFDYEVVERARSVAVISFDGMWRDMGTWNTLSKEINENIGQVISGEGTEDTSIINELDIPLVALGVKDMVIAASPDGILVSGKRESSFMKPYVNRLSLRPMYEERRWGWYKVLDYNAYDNGTRSLTKHLFVEKGKKLSYQSHALRDEIWTIIEGSGIVLLDGHTRNVRCGDVAYITAGMKHAISAMENLHVIEVQIGNELTETDIEQYAVEW